MQFEQGVSAPNWIISHEEFYREAYHLIGRRINNGDINPDVAITDTSTGAGSIVQQMMDENGVAIGDVGDVVLFVADDTAVIADANENVAIADDMSHDSSGSTSQPLPPHIQDRLPRIEDFIRRHPIIVIEDSDDESHITFSEN